MPTEAVGHCIRHCIATDILVRFGERPVGSGRAEGSLRRPAIRPSGARKVRKSIPRPMQVVQTAVRISSGKVRCRVSGKLLSSPPPVDSLLAEGIFGRYFQRGDWTRGLYPSAWRFPQTALGW